HIPISSYSRISACPLESALMLYQLSLGALLAVRAAMGASSARLLVVRIGASSVVIRLEPGPGDFQIATVLVHQLPRLGGSDHLAHAEVGLLYRLHRRHAFFLGVVIGVRAEHQPFFPVGLDLGNPAALEFLRVATAGAGNLRLIGKACLDQHLPGVCLFLRINPGHDRALIDGAVKGARVNVGRHHDLAGGDGYPQPLAVYRAAPVVDELVLQQVIPKLGLHQLLALGAVGAVIAAHDGGGAATGTGRHSPQLAIAEPFEEGVGPVALDHAQFFAGQQVVDNDARGDREATLLCAAPGNRILIGAALLDVHGQSSTDAGCDALGLLVVLDLRQPDQHSVQQRDAAALTDPLAMSDVDDAVSLHTLGVGAVQPESLHIAGVLLVQVVGPHSPPRITLNALLYTLRQIVVIERQVIRLQQLQGERYAGQVGVVGDPAAQLLRQRFTVSQPGAANQPLHLRTGQLAGGLRPQRPFRPALLDLCGEVQMHVS